MVHYYTAPATAEIVEYLRNGGRVFYTRKAEHTRDLQVDFLATEEYIEKMKARPFIQGNLITRKL